MVLNYTLKTLMDSYQSSLLIVNTLSIHLSRVFLLQIACIDCTADSLGELHYGILVEGPSLLVVAENP